MKKQKRLLQYDDNESMKDELIFLGIAFFLIFLCYIITILSVSTMVRFYDGVPYLTSFGDALFERAGTAYINQKLNELGQIEQTLEILYRMI